MAVEKGVERWRREERKGRWTGHEKWVRGDEKERKTREEREV